jgi:hypothetical protein
MKYDWQTIIAITIVLFAAVYAAKSFISPILSAMRPPKSGRCEGGCGCGHEDKSHDAT